MGAGILPIAFNGVSLMFLLGKEKTGQWSDFGGSSKDIYETNLRTAIREGYEESSGLLGNQYQIAMKIKNDYITHLKYDRYTTFAYKIDYDENLPVYFKRNYNFVVNTTPSIVNKYNNGLYEKTQIKWFTSSQVQKLELRPFYEKIIFKVIENEKKIEKLFINNMLTQNQNTYYNAIKSRNDFPRT